MFLVIFMFLALVVFGFYTVASTISKQIEENEKEYTRLVRSVKNCPPHGWSYHPQTNKMTCTKCNFEAGNNYE